MDEMTRVGLVIEVAVDACGVMQAKTLADMGNPELALDPREFLQVSSSYMRVA